MLRWMNALAGFLLLVVATATAAHPLDYRIDTVHSQVLFSVDHDGFSKPVGRLALARGWLRFDPADWIASRVVADIDLASADLGDQRWNAAVIGDKFLDAAKLPLAHFESTSVQQTGNHTGILEGNLTLRGVTLPVQIEFTVNRVGATLFGFETIAGFSGHATLDRRGFGIDAFPKAIGTEVDVRLEIEAKLDHQAQYDYRMAVEQSAREAARVPAQH